MLASRHRSTHARIAQTWIEYVNVRREQPSVHGVPARQLFYAFNSRHYGGFIPSEAYLLRVFVEDAETRSEFYRRRMQMIDGLVLAGDHSHKVAKLVHVGGARAFEGIYTLLNGYGQVVGYW